MAIAGKGVKGKEAVHVDIFEFRTESQFSRS